MSVRLLTLVVGVVLAGAVAMEPSTLAVVALASVVVAVAAACLVVLASASGLDPFGPASAHRHRVDAVPAPRHPNTVGRRRARAPSSVVVA